MSLTAAGTYPDRIAAAASYHGGRLATDAPESPHLLAPKMKARVYVAGAIEDASFPDEMKARLEDALTKAGVDHVIETYPGEARLGAGIRRYDAAHGASLEDAARAARREAEGLSTHVLPQPLLTGLTSGLGLSKLRRLGSVPGRSYLSLRGGASWADRVLCRAGHQWPAAPECAAHRGGLHFMLAGTMKLFAFPAGFLRTEAPSSWCPRWGSAASSKPSVGAAAADGPAHPPSRLPAGGREPVAYFQFHFPRGFWPVMNNGVSAALFCFMWLFFSAAGRDRGAWMRG